MYKLIYTFTKNRIFIFSLFKKLNLNLEQTPEELKKAQTTIKKFLERVDQNHSQKLKNQEEIEDELDIEFEENHPFTPAITNNSRRISELKSQAPIHLRYQQEIERKENNLLKMKEDSRRIKEAEISNARVNKKEHSKDSSDVKTAKDIYQIEMEWLNKKNRKLQEERAFKLDLEMSEKYNHVPVINKNSKKMASSTGESFLERQKVYSERKKQNSEIIYKDMYHNNTHSPKINFNTLEIVHKSIKQKLKEVQEQHGDSCKKQGYSKAVKTSQFDPQAQIVSYRHADTDQGDSDDEIQPIRTFRKKSSRMNQYSKDTDMDLKYFNDSPPGTKHLRIHKEQGYVYDTNTYINKNEQPKPNYFSTVKKYSLGIKQGEGVPYTELKETKELFDQIDDNNHYFEDTKKYIEKNEEFAPASILKSKSSLVSPDGLANRRKIKSTHKSKSRSRSKSSSRSVQPKKKKILRTKSKVGVKAVKSKTKSRSGSRPKSRKVKKVKKSGTTATKKSKASESGKTPSKKRATSSKKVSEKSSIAKTKKTSASGVKSSVGTAGTGKKSSKVSNVGNGMSIRK